MKAKTHNIHTYFYSLVLCLSTIVAHAADRTDWKEDGLKGKVREVRTYNVKENPNSIEKASIRRIFKYDKNGNRLEEKHYNEYDEEDGVLTSRLIYKYKKKKNLVERTIYDQYKKLIEKALYNENRLRVEDEDYSYGMNLHWRTVNKYDENQHIIKETRFVNDSLYDIVSYKYDEKKNLTEETHTNPQFSWNNQKFVNKYDENGNRIEILEYGNDEDLKFKTIYKYNDKKKCIEESVYDSNGTLCSHLLSKYNDEGKKIESAHYVVEDGLMQKDKYIVDEKTSVSLRYNPDGELGRVAVSKFDEVGNPLETMIYCGDDWIFYYGTYYEYEYYK